MAAAMYHVKNILNALSCLILIAGGISVIILAEALPNQLPFSVLTSATSGELVATGILLMLLAIVPLVTCLYRINIRWGICQKLQNQIFSELPWSSGDSVTMGMEEETVVATMSENLTLQVRDPRLLLNDLDTEFLLLTIQDQGEMRFPMPPSKQL
jgi:hypothetical protein